MKPGLFQYIREILTKPRHHWDGNATSHKFLILAILQKDSACFRNIMSFQKGVWRVFSHPLNARPWDNNLERKVLQNCPYVCWVVCSFHPLPTIQGWFLSVPLISKKRAQWKIWMTLQLFEMRGTIQPDGRKKPFGRQASRSFLDLPQANPVQNAKMLTPPCHSFGGLKLTPQKLWVSPWKTNLLVVTLHGKPTYWKLLVARWWFISFLKWSLSQWTFPSFFGWGYHILQYQVPVENRFPSRRSDPIHLVVQGYLMELGIGTQNTTGEVIILQVVYIHIYIYIEIQMYIKVHIFFGMYICSCVYI